MKYLDLLAGLVYLLCTTVVAVAAGVGFMLCVTLLVWTGYGAAVGSVALLSLSAFSYLKYRRII